MARNDSFFAPAIARAMHQSFTAGGGDAGLTVLPPWGEDGHLMFFGRSGSETWGPVVAEFLRRTGVGP